MTVLEASSEASTSAATIEAQPVSAAVDFVAGTVAGVASLLVGHPFDTIKVRLQCQDSSSGKRYRDSVHALASILREEKVSGLYKGVTSPMLGVAVVNASVFGFYGLAMRLQLSDPATSPTLAQVTLAGSASGVFTSIVTTPIERLKILQQSAPSHLRQPTLLHLIRTNSIPSLYRGLTATLFRDLAYGPYFLVYEAISRGGRKGIHADLKEEIDEDSREVGWARLLMAGGAAGIVGWGCTFPIDVVKSRIQASERFLPSGEPHPFRTTWSTFRLSYRNEGIKVFTSGLGPTLLRAIPVNAVTFFVFEAVVASLR